MSKPSISISIIVPIYNVEEYLDECLASIYALDIKSYQVILVNDGSTDNSYSIAKRYADNFSHLTTLINKKNGGLSSARNAGLINATGDWISFIDSDDYIDPVAFKKVVLAAIASTADVITFTGKRFISETGEQTSLNHIDNPFVNKGPIGGKEYLATNLDAGLLNTVCAWNKIYRHSRLTKLNIRFIEGLIHEDVPFTFNLLTTNQLTIHYLNEDAYFYRIRAGSIMTTASTEKLSAKIKVIRLLLALLKQREINYTALNGYLVFLASSVIKDGMKVPYSILVALFKLKMSMRKRSVLSILFIMNLKINGR